MFLYGGNIKGAKLCRPGMQVPYDALRYMVGECNYGGRVTDDKDRLLLNGLLRVCLSPQTAEAPNHPFSPSATYSVPSPGPIKQYLEYIDSLPIAPAPEAFGLHVNADIQKDQNDTATLCR